MILQYQLTEAEIVRGILKIRGRSVKDTYMPLLLAAAGILLALHSSHLPALQAEKYFWIGCIMLGLAITLPILWPRFIRSAIVKFVGSTPAFTNSQETTFDEDGLKFSSPSLKQEVDWTGYKKLMQDDHYIYLHSGVYGLFTILPKRAFDDASLTEFMRCSQSLQQA